MSERVVIVGSGHAGTQVAISLRQRGFAGAIALVGDEAHAPYQRPPLSKRHLLGELDEAQVLLRPADWYAEQEIMLFQGARATALDLDDTLVTLADGEQLRYDQLVLATGSRLRRLQVPGVELPGVHYLRTLDDSRTLGAALQPGARLVVIGGGYIGLEVAASARQRGLAVTVLEQAPRLLARVASTEMAAAVARLHEAAGVELRYGVEVVAIEGAGAVERVLLAGGETLAADLLVVGIGIEPETALAEEAGLRVDDGVVVDEYCLTSHPRVLAAGDCTSHPNRFVRHRVRLESVPNASGQARTVAATICGERIPYADAPWFWSEQYHARLQTAGLPDASHETLLRGDPAGDSFALFHVREGRLMCVEALNRTAEFMLSRRLIEADALVDEALADDATPFKAIADACLRAPG